MSNVRKLDNEGMRKKLNNISVVFWSSCKQTFPPLPKMNGIKDELTMWMEYLGSKCVLLWPRH